MRLKRLTRYFVLCRSRRLPISPAFESYMVWSYKQHIIARAAKCRRASCTNAITNPWKHRNPSSHAAEQLKKLIPLVSTYVLLRLRRNLHRSYRHRLLSYVSDIDIMLVDRLTARPISPAAAASLAIWSSSRFRKWPTSDSFGNERAMAPCRVPSVA